MSDVRRVLGLAAMLPGLRRVDLVTNHRCPPEVVSRAARLIAHGQERFAKQILPSSRASGTLTLASDPGDAVSRARRLLTAWFGRLEGGYAVLSRTNAELAPYAAVALERAIPYRVEEDGLALDERDLEVVRAAATTTPPDWPLLRRIGTCAHAADSHALGRLLTWAAAYRTLDELFAALDDARARRSVLRTDEARLVLATVHGTKGLEFDHVAVVGLDDGVFPSRRALEESTEPARVLEEERRLAYVAWTRARKTLTLVYDPDAPSVFMREAFDPNEIRPGPSADGRSALA